MGQMLHVTLALAIDATSEMIRGCAPDATRFKTLNDHFALLIKEQARRALEESVPRDE